MPKLKLLLPGALVALSLVAVGANSVRGQSQAYEANCGDDSVSVIRVATSAAGNRPARATVSVRPEGDARKYCPVAMAVSPHRGDGARDGQFVYVANSAVNSLSVIDTAEGKLAGPPIAVGRKPAAVAISPGCLNPLGQACNPGNPLQGTFAYVVNSGSRSVTVVDTDPRSATFHQVVTTILVGPMPSAVAASRPILEPGPHGMSLSSALVVYVANSADNTVSVIDADVTHTATFHKVVKTIQLKPSGVKPVGLAFDRTSKWAYVVNGRANNVIPIETSTHSAMRPIAVGADPSGIAVTEGFAGQQTIFNFRAYVANRGSRSFSVIDVDPASPRFQQVIETTTLSATEAADGITVNYPDDDFVYITRRGVISVSVDDSGGPPVGVVVN